jgi:tetratricopeptide (TPR) repeat protein
VTPIVDALESMKQVTAAEQTIREFVAKNRAKNPRADLVLAKYLGRHGQLQEALDLCEVAWKTCPPDEVAATCAFILGAGAADSTPFLPRVEKWLADALAKQPNAGDLLSAMGYLRSLQGRLADAEALYRKALSGNPKDFMALNNLAWLLAHETGKSKEALEKINRALDLMGGQPALLDTRAVAEMAADEVDKALGDLVQAVTVQPQPSMYLHLAQAHLMKKNRNAARDALRKSEEQGLKASSLDPLDKADYTRLKKALEQQPQS